MLPNESLTGHAGAHVRERVRVQASHELAVMNGHCTLPLYKLSMDSSYSIPMMKVQEKLEKPALAVMRIATTTSTRNMVGFVL